MTRLFLFLPLFLLACGIISTAQLQATIPPNATQTPYKTLTPTPMTDFTCARVIALVSLNLRSAPSDKAGADKAGLRNGDVVQVLGKQDGWFRVEVGGKRGWVNGQYILPLTSCTK